MENELQTNLDEILLDKETNLLPENLKEGVTVLGVEGSLKVTGSDSNIKLFETIEDMNNDPNPKEDDLAVVYREETQPFKEDTETQFITFPEQVVLDEPFTSNVYGMLRAVDESVMFDGQVMLDESMFDFNGYSETGMIQVRYQSEDGITYTRQEFMGDSGDLTNPVDLGTVVKWEPMEPFNDVVGKFMLVGSNYFEGLYEFNGQLEKDLIKLIPLENVTFNLDASNGFSNFQIDYNSNYIFSLTKVVNILNKINDEYNNDTRGYILCIDSDGDLCALEGRVSDSDMFIHPANDWDNPIYDFNKNFLGIAWYRTGSYDTSTTPYIRKYSLNLNDSTFSIKGNTLPKLTGGDSSTSPHTKYWPVDIVTIPMYITISTTSPNDFTISYYASSGSTYDRVSSSFNYTNEVYQEKYRIAPTQLTLDNVNQLLPDTIAYGKNGNITGDGSICTPNNTFDDIPAMLYSEIQAKYDNMEPVVLTNENHIIENIISNSIYTIPVRSDGTPLLDVSNVTNCYNMFQRCKNLKSIPNLEFNNITNASRMFNVCSNITDINSIDLSNCNNATYMFDNCNKLNTINVTNVENIQNTYAMFGATNISEVNNLNFAKATNVARAFASCKNLINVNNINVMSAGKNIGNMFSNCPNLKHVDNFYFNTNNISNVFTGAGFKSTSDLNIDWSKITQINYVFSNCKNLYDIYNLSMPNINNISQLYPNCINIKELPSNYLEDNFPNATIANSAFVGCTNLYLQNNSFYSEKLTSVSGLFSGCANIKQIDNLYLPNTTNTSYMFYNCDNLVSATNLNIPKCNYLAFLFSNCSNLITVDNINFANNTYCSSMFQYCTSLTNIPNIPYNKISVANYMFRGCINITNIEDEINLCNCNCVDYIFSNTGLIDIDMNKIKLKSSINSVNGMFDNCENLVNVTNFNLAGTSVNYYANLFNGCKELSYSIQMYTSNNMYNCYAMFSGCENFKNIPNINYNNIQYCSSFMFANCRNITNIDNLNLNKINQCADMFANCINLTTISNLNLYNTVNAQWLFADCINLSNIDNIVFNRVNWLFRAFANCTNLVNAPNMKLNSCYRIESLFENCINLTNIPMYNTLKVYRCQNFVNNCPNLSNDSLNNVLQMCSNMNCMYNLKYIGLTQNQVNICMNLSNYQNFINAGWTTGY